MKDIADMTYEELQALSEERRAAAPMEGYRFLRQGERLTDTDEVFIFVRGWDRVGATHFEARVGPADGAYPVGYYRRRACSETATEPREGD